jgi:Prokaryotic homologs of the JAB domain
MGEHVDTNTFRVVEFTTQMQGGTVARFVRLLDGVIRPLRAFFKATKHEYVRFNYLGEWHSHPAFALEPSTTDQETMREIVEDPSVGARFALLLLVRLGSAGELQTRVVVYEANQTSNGTLVLEN